VTSHALIPNINIEEYLSMEQAGEVRHEYIAGQLFAMVGASRVHNTIALNIASFFHTHLRGSPCQAFMADMKVRVEKAEAFYYPDIVVTCEPRDDNALFLRAPSLIVEVLSPATENIDRREKRLAYQRLESLKEYVLVAQQTRRAEVYRRSKAEAAWEVDIYEGNECAVLQALDLKLPLEIVYEGIG
jgi:Uma2 family endonuclease